jgi:Fe2+ or Zn2+ uptake regulation protein
VTVLPTERIDRTSVLPPRIEPPHAHAVCRLCGRIADVDLRLEDLRQLEELAQRRPGGWYVEGITFSLTGACPRCRHGARPA